MQNRDVHVMMFREDYKERFKTEYWQLKIRYEKLWIMTSRWDKGYDDCERVCPRSIYNLQMDAMKQYLAVLEARTKIEGIKLDE